MTVAIVLANVVVALLAPGWLLMRVTGWPPSRLDRGLLVGPMSFAVVGVAAAILGTLHRALDLPTLLAIDLALAVAAWRRRRRADGEPVPAFDAAIMLFPGLFVVALTAFALGGLGYPPGEDSLVHAATVRWFQEGLPAPPYLPDLLRSSADPEVRYGWHVMAALLTWGTGIDPGRAVSLCTLATVAWLPGGLLVVVRRLGFDQLSTLATGLATLGFGLVPFKVLALGQQPRLLGAFLLAPAAAAAWCDALERRELGVALVAALLAGGVVYAHPSDAPTALILFAVLVVANRRRIRRSPTAPEVAAVLCGVVALLALTAIWFTYTSHPTSGIASGPPVRDAVADDGFFASRTVSSLWPALGGELVSLPGDWLLPVLAGYAAIVGWRDRRTRLLVALGIVLLALQVDAWAWQVPRRLLVRVYPWPAPDRLVALDWYVLAPLAAMGAVSVVRRLRSRRPSWTLRRPGVSTPRVEWAMALSLVLVATLPTLLRAPLILVRAHEAQTGITEADLAAFPQVARLVPRGDLVLTDGTADGGAWLPLLTDVSTLLHKGWNDDRLADDVRDALRGLCSPGEAARLAALHVHWVYLGPAPVASPADADRSCAATGTSELAPVHLDGAGRDGPWLLYVPTQP